MVDKNYVFTGPSFYNFDVEASENKAISIRDKLVDDLTVDEFLGILEGWDLGEPGDSWCGSLRQGANIIKDSYPIDHKFRFAELGVFGGGLTRKPY